MVVRAVTPEGVVVLRRLSGFVALTLPVLTLVVLPVSRADAVTTTGPSDPHVYVACGIGTTRTPAGEPCLQLDDAVAAATADTASTVTIDLLPGQYCPVTIPDATHRTNLVGIGRAAGPGDGSTGLESTLSTFTWSTGCTAGPQAFITTDVTGYHGLISLQNLAVDGSGPTGGPTTGVFVETPAGTGAGLMVRDVQVQHLTQGIEYHGSGLQLQNSAVVDNVNGLYVPGTATVVNTTFAGNTDTALSISGTGNLFNNTITHNANGLRIPTSGSDVTGSNNIIAANTTADCVGQVGPGGDWEAGFPSASNTNLIGTTCRTDNSDASGDIAFDVTTTIAAAADNGGPTSSILPPAQAQATGTADRCGPGRVSTDQREGDQTATTCDIGSVQQTATLTPTLGSGPVAFGNVPVGQSAGYTVVLMNGSGGLVPVESVELTGSSAFTLGSDGCTWALLYRGAGSCSVTVSLTATPRGPLSGTLVFHTVAGDLSEPVTATGVLDTTSWAPPKGAGTIAYGASTTVSDTLDDETVGGPLAGVTVTLMASAYPKKTFSPVKTLTTSAAGVVTASVAPKVATVYRWSYAGDDTHAASTSSTTTVTVRPVLHVHLQKTSVKKGQRAVVYGTATPVSNGRSVTIQRRAGSTWKTVTTAKIKSQVLPGKKAKQTGFLYSFTTTAKGASSYRVVLPAGVGLQTATSPTLLLHVT